MLTPLRLSQESKSLQNSSFEEESLPKTAGAKVKEEKNKNRGHHLTAPSKIGDSAGSVGEAEQQSHEDGAKLYESSDIRMVGLKSRRVSLMSKHPLA